MPPRLCPPTACGLWKSRLLLLGLWKSRARFPDPESRRPRCAADARCNQLSPQGHRARESAHAARGLFRCLVQALTFPSHGTAYGGQESPGPDGKTKPCAQHIPHPVCRPCGSRRSQDAPLRLGSRILAGSMEKIWRTPLSSQRRLRSDASDYRPGSGPHEAVRMSDDLRRHFTYLPSHTACRNVQFLPGGQHAYLYPSAGACRNPVSCEAFYISTRTFSESGRSVYATNKKAFRSFFRHWSVSCQLMLSTSQNQVGMPFGASPCPCCHRAVRAGQSSSSRSQSESALCSAKGNPYQAAKLLLRDSNRFPFPGVRTGAMKRLASTIRRSTDLHDAWAGAKVWKDKYKRVGNPISWANPQKPQMA